MSRKPIFALLVFLSLILSACGNSVPTVNNSQVVIDSGSHHIEGNISEPLPYQYLMKDEGVSFGGFTGDAFLTLIPLATADKLKAQFGDFFHCDDPGAKQAMQSLQTVILVAGDVETQKAIAKAMGLVRESKVPSVQFNASKVSVTRYTYNGLDARDPSGIPIYYLTDFMLLKENYMDDVAQ